MGEDVDGECRGAAAVGHRVVVAGGEGDCTGREEIDEDVFVSRVNNGGLAGVVHLPIKDGGGPRGEAVVILLVDTDIGLARYGGILLDDWYFDRGILRASIGAGLSGIGHDTETIDQAGWLVPEHFRHVANGIGDVSTLDVPLVATFDVGGVGGALVLAGDARTGDGDGVAIVDMDVKLKLAGTMTLVVNGKHNGVITRLIPVVGRVLLVAEGAVAEVPQPRDDGAKFDSAEVEENHFLLDAEHMVSDRWHDKLGLRRGNNLNAEINGAGGVSQILGDAECAAAVRPPGDIDRGARRRADNVAPSYAPLVGGVWVGVDGIALGGVLTHFEARPLIFDSEA